MALSVDDFGFALHAPDDDQPVDGGLRRVRPPGQLGAAKLAFHLAAALIVLCLDRSLRRIPELKVERAIGYLPATPRP